MDTIYSSQITQLLVDIGKGNKYYIDKLMPLVYNEFKAIANRYLIRESPDHTFQSTDLVHEAYVKLVDQKRVDWNGRSHFYAIGAITMRRILVDHARSKKSSKRGGDLNRISLDDGLPLSTNNEADILVLEDILNNLEKLDKIQAKIVELKFYGGLKNKEVAVYLDRSERFVKSEWRMARAWLLSRLGNRDSR